VALILDSGPLLASIDRRDANYVACRQLIESADEPIVVPGPVLVEVDYFIHTRLHPGVRLTLLDNIVSGTIRIEELIADEYQRVRELCERYADADFGFVDAAVLAIVERLNEPKLATLDHRHFGVLRPRHVDSLTLLP
jgi:predicted nucleic acid-binding protein